MTVGKKFKKRIRERMARTGESYTAARLALIEEKTCTCGPSITSDDASPSCPVHGDKRWAK